MTRKQFVRGAAAFMANFGAGMAVPAWARAANLQRRDLSQHAVVVPDAASADEAKAAAALARHLGAALRRAVPVIAEASAGRRPALFIGDTRFSRRHRQGLAPLVEDGFALVPDGDNLIVRGGAGQGLSNAVYGLLVLWGFRLFASDALHTPAAVDLGLPDRPIVATPRIGYRTMLYADTEKGEYPAWHRLSPTDRWGMFVHTFNDLVPPDVYGASHPEYFSLVDGRRLPGTQLCLSNADMRSVLIGALAQRIADKPEATYWSVSQNDNDRNCRCAECAALDARYGGQRSGSILHFVNQVARAFPGKTISTLAYWYSRTPPSGIRAEPNVNIMLCNIESARHAPVYETDPAFTRDLAGWGAIADSILIWDYDIQFTNLVSPFPNLHTIKPNIDHFVRNGVDALFLQANREGGGEFAELRAYLMARLMWDPAADDGAIIDEFLAGYYGAAAPHIRRYIDTMRERLVASRHVLDIFGSPERAKDSYLTAEAMADYTALFDRAGEAVAGDAVLSRRVRSARLPIDYARIQIARNEPVDAPRGLYVRERDGHVAARPEMVALVDRFAATCIDDGVTRLRERSTSPADYKASYDRVFAGLATMRTALSPGKPVVLAAPGDRPDAAARLTDGLFGSWESWSAPDPNWVAFTGKHLDAMIDLGTVRDIREIAIGFLNAQAQPDYNTLKLPEFVEFSVSADGRDFTTLGRVRNPHDPDPRTNPDISKVPVYRFAHVATTPLRARYVRVHARSMLTMPGWHIMAGKPATIATDQLVVA